MFQVMCFLLLFSFCYEIMKWEAQTEKIIKCQEGNEKKERNMYCVAKQKLAKKITSQVNVILHFKNLICLARNNKKGHISYSGFDK